MDLNTASNRVRAFGYFIIAFVYFYFAQVVAVRAAAGLSSGDWTELVGRTILLFLLLVGYGLMGRASKGRAIRFRLWVWFLDRAGSASSVWAPRWAGAC